MLLVEILAGDAGRREARQRWLGRFALLLECGQGSGSQPQGGWLARMTAGALASLLALGSVESEDLAWIALWPSQGGKAGAAIGVEVDEAPAKERSSKRRVWAEQRKRVQRARMLAAFDTAISPIEARVRAAVASAGSATGRAEELLPELVFTVTALAPCLGGESAAARARRGRPLSKVAAQFRRSRSISPRLAVEQHGVGETERGLSHPRSALRSHFPLDRSERGLALGGGEVDADGAHQRRGAPASSGRRAPWWRP